MQIPKKTKIFFAGLITISALGLFGATLFRALYYAPSDEVSLSDISTPNEVTKSELGVVAPNIPIPTDPSYPSRLTIPKINVDTKVTQVGITRKGNMATPSNFTDVGWYKYGAVPGALGSAVIAGHLDDGLALPAVFSNLKDLSAGDDIYVTTSGGKELHFKVTSTNTYDFNSNVPEVFTGSDGKILRLITCAGNWLAQFRTHDKRLVVNATLV